MIYMKILKKGGGRRKRNPCPMRLWLFVEIESKEGRKTV
jgi:hypothetical protein